MSFTLGRAAKKLARWTLSDAISKGKSTCHTRVTLKHPPPSYNDCLQDPCVGRWIRHGAQGPPWRGVRWGLDPLRWPTTPLEGGPLDLGFARTSSDNL